MITVIGLGFREGSVSKRGLDTIQCAGLVVFRTTKTRAAKSLVGLCHGSFDYLYEKASSYDELNATIASELIRLNAEYPDLVYCVDGDGYKDSSVVELSKRTEINVICGPFDLPIPPATSCTYLSAYDLSEEFYPDPSIPLCVYGIDDAHLAGDVKLFLLRFYGAEQKALLCSENGMTHIQIMDLDRQKEYIETTAVLVECGNNSSFAELTRIMKRLTAPDGCPWDKAQTHQSIRINLIEEAYEAVQAITDGNFDGMIEELGDVLLQVVFHCDIALRSDEFTLEDVIKGLNDKLVSRHSHIFGTDKADSASGALNVWEKNKMKEKHQSTFAAAVNDVPSIFPALLRAQKVAKRVEKGGWKREEFCGSIEAQLASVLDKVQGGDKTGAARSLGKLLFALAWLSQATGEDCEQELLDVVLAVQKQYDAYESMVIADGKDVNALSLDERKQYYDRVKNGTV